MIEEQIDRGGCETVYCRKHLPNTKKTRFISNIVALDSSSGRPTKFYSKKKCRLEKSKKNRVGETLKLQSFSGKPTGRRLVAAECRGGV